MVQVDIVGGSGFIGTRLTRRLLQAGHFDIRIIDRLDSKSYQELVHKCDITDLKSLRKALRPNSIVVNLAAEHRDNVSPTNLYHKVNVEGALNICRVCTEHHNQKIIFTSSVAVYGFAEIGTDESGKIAPFNEYGRTKHQAEKVFADWQNELPAKRSLIIIRPTVVFGEGNRGNVYNLLKAIASRRFLMVGTGLNRKSIAYVENVAAFIEFCLQPHLKSGTFNFVDKPDYDMNGLVDSVRRILGTNPRSRLRIPRSIALCMGYSLDLISLLTGKKFSLSAVRVRKFCANSVYSSGVDATGFTSPVPLELALQKTVCYEFIENHKNRPVFFSE